MLGKWILQSWLFGWSPSFPNPGIQINYQIQNNQISNGAHPFCINGLGAAWAATLQFPILIIPWLASHNVEYKQRRGFEKTQLLKSSNQAFYGLVGMHTLSLDFGNFFSKASQVFYPSVLVLSSAVIPPLEKMPKLLPSQVDADDIESSSEDSFFQQEVASYDITTSQIPISNRPMDDFQKIVREPKTGFQFPIFLCDGSVQSQPFCTDMQVLAGIGLKNVSVMKLKSIKIYAFGFYIKPDILKAKFSEKYGGTAPGDLKCNSLFFEELLRHDLEMTVRLVVHYKGLKMSMVKSAFDGSLRNRLKKIKGVEYDEGLDTFNSYFSKDMSVPQGTIIDFQRFPGGEFRTTIDGKLIGRIHSHDFCRAFFDIYIGNPPVCLKTKEDIGETLSQLMRSK